PDGPEPAYRAEHDGRAFRQAVQQHAEVRRCVPDMTGSRIWSGLGAIEPRKGAVQSGSDDEGGAGEARVGKSWDDPRVPAADGCVLGPLRLKRERIGPQ